LIEIVESTMGTDEEQAQIEGELDIEIQVGTHDTLGIFNNYEIIK
jgi:hypothetical protein